MKARPIDRIPIQELEKYGVWEFDLDEEDYEDAQDESWVCPVRELPVHTLVNRIAVTRLTLANGTQIPGMLGNVDLAVARRHREFVGVSVCKDDHWFHLARYFDVDYDEAGPSALAEFLGLSVTDVFPLRYDISAITVGLPEVMRGSIPAEPLARLTREERFDLIFGRTQRTSNEPKC